MSREIKFRAFDGKEIIEVHTLEFSSDISRINMEVESSYNKWPLMQYTGLKDKNGKEIYEGDIVMWHGGGAGNENKIGDVYYEDAGFKVRNYFLGFLDNPSDAFGEGLHTIRVIGNIYSNPELLK